MARPVALALHPREERHDHLVKHVEGVVLGARLVDAGEGEQGGDAAVGRHARDRTRPRARGMPGQRRDAARRDVRQVQPADVEGLERAFATQVEPLVPQKVRLRERFAIKGEGVRRLASARVLR